MADNLDLLGGAPIGMDTGLLSAVSDGVNRGEGAEPDPKELAAVKTLKEEYDAAREFDKKARKQYGKDRRYASGVSDIKWASDANVTGAIIDILKSYLYAKDPTYAASKAKRVKVMPSLADVSPLPAMPMGLGPQIAPPSPIAAPGAVDPMMPAPPTGGMAPGMPVPGAAPIPGMPVPGAPPPVQPSQTELDSDQFADTLNLVINRLWKDAKLKMTGRRQVLSALSVGPGWFKGLFFSESKQDPQVADEIRDLKGSMERLQGLQKKLQYDGYACPEDRDAAIAEIETSLEGLGPKVEKVVRQGLNIDFVPAEQMTVWLNVATTEDYLKADALGEDIYVLKTQLCTRFPRLTEDEIKAASGYFMRKTSAQELAAQDADADNGDGQYQKGTPNTSDGNTKMSEFAKVVEVWDRRDGMIKTMVEGVKRWAVEPFPPPQSTTRFYSYFRLALYESDGQRHPQSLPWRLYKLQDEYASCRSNQRLTRERSVPGIIFNEAMIGKDDVRKLTDSTQQEYIGITPTDVNARMDQLLFQKAVGTYDPRIYDTTPIVADMAKISGVQEPQQGVGNPEITATQSQIEESGFRSRTGTDRDTLEDMFRDFASWCTEASLQAISAEFATRIAGPSAYWPVDMDLQDILTLVEVDIEAGSTGKPGGDASRAAWGTLLPQIQELQTVIRQFDLTDPPLAQALRNTLRETIRRLDDKIDVEQFIPPATNPPLMPPLPPPGAAPGPNGKGTPAKAAGTPPGAPMIP